MVENLTAKGKAANKRFLEHGQLNLNVSIKVKSLVDQHNMLGINLITPPPEYRPHLKALLEQSPTLKPGPNQINIHIDQIAKKDMIYRRAMNIQFKGKQKLNVGKGGNQPVASASKNLNKEKHSYISQCSLLMILRIAINGKQIGPEMYTSHVKNFVFDEKIIFPVKYKDLTPNSSLGIEIFDMNKPEEESLVGSTTIDLFDYKKCLRQGHYSLYVHKGKEVDLEVNTETPGLNDEYYVREKNILNAYIDNYNNNEMKKIPWLDALAYQNIQNKTNSIINQANFAFLEVSLPHFKYPVLFSESTYNYDDLFMTTEEFEKMHSETYEEEEEKSDNLFSISEEKKKEKDNEGSSRKPVLEMSKTIVPLKTQVTSLAPARPHTRTTVAGSLQSPILGINQPSSGSTSIEKIIKVYDPCVQFKSEIMTTNPISAKYYMLTRDIDDSIAKELRPSHEERFAIDQILGMPDFMKLNPDDRNLLWRYRYSMLDRPDALPKFLRVVNWENEKEEKEALKLLSKWAPVEIEHALSLLSCLFAANEIYEKKVYPAYREIRKYAAERLSEAPEDEIHFILLQLVQAYRYEDFQQSSLKDFFLNKTGNNSVLATSFYWHVRVEVDNKEKDNKDSENISEQYEFLLNEFMEELRTNPEKKHIYKNLENQKKLRETLSAVAESIKSGKHKDKNDALRNMIFRGGKYDLSKIEPTQIPVDPRLVIHGVINDPKLNFVFKSATYPLKLGFQLCPECIEHTKDNSDKYHVIYKKGDDMRQDQLILQMVVLMDHILSSINLNFRFTTYKVASTSPDDGFMEFVTDSKTIHDIIEQKNGKIENYFEESAKTEKRDYNEILDTFIRSCAGYCVVTFILGVGDRHLENLLITKDGRLFHIDFGYILGQDPKIFPPPIRICEQMVDAMGGRKSDKYEDFKKKCVDAFMHLRRKNKYIVNLFHLMIHSGVKDLKEQTDVRLMKLFERFMFTKTEQEAERQFLQLLSESVNAFFPKVMELIHNWALYWK